MKKIDERNTMLSRIRYTKQDEMYRDYYLRHPEKQAIDDAIRAMPGINAEGTPTYHPIFSPFADSGFDFLSHLKLISKQEAKGVPVEVNSAEMTSRIKNLALYLGATDVKIAKMKPEHYYSHRGRNIENYGKEVGEPYEYGIVFTKEMDQNMINRAPQLEEMMEVVKAYVDLGVMGMWLSIFISNLGYEAKNNMDMDYLVCAPIVAQDAGLGRIGRAGLLVTKEQGMRVRLGVVTTNLPLIPDDALETDLLAFCSVCKKCAQNCPSGAIDKGEAAVQSQGYYGFKVNQEKCMKMWKTIGTDCGICLSSCPFSQGVSSEMWSDLKANTAQILEKDLSENGKRKYIKEALDLVK